MDVKQQEPTIPPISTTDQQIKSSPLNSNFPIKFGVALLVLLAIGGAYYFGTQTNKNFDSENLETAQVVTPSEVQVPTTILTPATAKNINPSIPKDWVFKTSTACNVDFPIPPKQPPYFTPKTTSSPGVGDDGRYWQFQEPDSSPETIFEHTAYATMISDQEAGSGYVSGIVTVNCGPNSNNYTTQTLSDTYAKFFTDGTFSGLTVSKRENTTLWGKSVAVIYVAGGMYDGSQPIYLLATNNHIYKISSLSLSSNPFIRQTTEDILKGLNFKD